MRELGFKKVLFLVHREQILKQAKRSYENVFSNRITTGILSGNHKEKDADYLFSTVQTMSRDYILTEFEEDMFDCIIIDETHKAGAESYHKIINHFKPKLLLGMTASPERTDGFDIYKLFGHNIASEIRLQDALEDDLLCPFHYFGISDLVIDGKEIDEKTEFKYLANEQRVEHIIKQTEYFGYSGNRVKGLIFCSRKEEAKALSDAFNYRGYNTVALSGDDSQEKREEAIERLEMECEVDNCGRPIIKSEVVKHNQPLDYIFTVDIFNEGVDIPQVNQVIMLRPTQSAIIFVQQLGRGLRKADNKEYVVILDFIGNYSNNFLIPIALSGDRTYNKDNVRKYVREGSRLLPGCSTIHFDEITKKKIFASIDRMTTTKKMLTEKYMQVKFKIGRIPTIIDFYKLGEIDPMLFINYAKTYDNFQRAVDKDYTVVFTEKEEQILAFISSLIIDGKRPHELLMLKMMLDGKSVAIDSFAKKYKNVKQYMLISPTAINILSNKLPMDAPVVDQQQYLDDYAKRADSENIKVKILGDITALSKGMQKSIRECMERTKNNTGVTFNIALNYGGRDEIVKATRKIAEQVKQGKIDVDEINEKMVSDNLYTAGEPDPDLVIRTSGEIRLSGFLPWQSVYSELLFVNKNWPDFTENDLDEAIIEYQKRTRKFGAN